MQLPPEQNYYRSIQMSGCLAIALLIFLGCVLPFMLVDLAQTALKNLHLSGSLAVFVLLGLVIGSVMNLPVARFPLDEEVSVPLFDQPFGRLPGAMRYQTLRQECIISVNVGGCVIPVLLGIRQMTSIVHGGMSVILVALVGIGINSIICYKQAKLVPRVGIALSPFIPVLVALLVTRVGLQNIAPRDYYAPVAFVIGITGPLIGADLMHWKDFQKIQAARISIGGAGTFDGIVLSGLLAALFA